jgi:hypothetical protein
VLAKHSKSFSLIDCVAVGVDRMQRNFEPMRKQVEGWQSSELTDVTAKVVRLANSRVQEPQSLRTPFLITPTDLSIDVLSSGFVWKSEFGFHRGAGIEGYSCGNRHSALADVHHLAWYFGPCDLYG